MANPSNEQIIENIEKLNEIKEHIISMKILNVKYREPFFVEEDGDVVNLAEATKTALIADYNTRKALLPALFNDLL